MEEQPQMGISISLESGSFSPPENQQEQEERIIKRKGLVSPAVVQAFPDRDFIGEVANQMSRSRDELNDEDKGYAQHLERQYSFNRERLVTTLSETQIEDTVLVEYANTIFALQNEAIIYDSAMRPEDTPRFIDASESLDKAKLFLSLARNWRQTHDLPQDRIMAARKVSRLQTMIMDISGANIFPRPETRDLVETTDLFNFFTELEEYEETLEGRVEQRTRGTFVALAKRVALETHTTDQSRRLMQIVDEVADLSDERAKNTYIQTVSTYTRNHELTEESHVGLREKLLPAIQANEPQVAIVVKGGNIWGMRRGDFGAGDFICHAYASEIRPRNINELLMALREVPSTDLARLEQNRLDALTLMAPFGALRDFIHDQRPLVHETITAMVHYYDTKDATRLSELLPKTEGYLASIDRQQAILNLDAYESQVQEEVNGQQRTTSAIEVLRRLVKNTAPIEEEPPTTKDLELNERMHVITGNDNKYGKQADVGSLLDHLSQRLIHGMATNEVGIEPDMVAAIAWAERQSFHVLQALNYEDQQSAYSQDWFVSILRFQELTASAQTFDEQEFNEFMQRVKQLRTSDAAYNMISGRTIKRVHQLAQRYKQQGNEDMTGALWSGNTDHELIGLIDYRPPSTVYGEKHREEKIKPLHERLKGD